MDILERTNFKKKLPISSGVILFEYIHQNFTITIPDKIKQDLWNRVLAEYKDKCKDYPQLLAGDPKSNATIMAMYKGEVVRAYLFNNKEIFNKLKNG